MADIGADTLGSSAKGAHSIGDAEIDLVILVNEWPRIQGEAKTHLPGVRLSRNRIGRLESGLLAEDLERGVSKVVCEMKLRTTEGSPH
jgi:hypothetical protein